MMAVVFAMKEAPQGSIQGTAVEDRQAGIPEGDTNEHQSWNVCVCFM